MSPTPGRPRGPLEPDRGLSDLPLTITCLRCPTPGSSDVRGRPALPQSGPTLVEGVCGRLFPGKFCPVCRQGRRLCLWVSSTVPVLGSSVRVRWDGCRSGVVVRRGKRERRMEKSSCRDRTYKVGCPVKRVKV